MPRRQWRQARPPGEADSTTRKERAQRRRERARAQELEGNNESNGWAPTTKEPKDESQAQSMKQVPIHASARRGRAEEAEEAEGAEGAEGDAESHYTMADSVCAGGTVERTRRTARPRTAGTACSSWPEGVPRDFSLEASKAPVLFHQKWCFLGCLLVLAWGETTNRTMADGREWYSCRTIRCGSGSWQDCGAGLWNRRQAHGVLAVTGSIPLGGSPRLLSVARALLPKRVFYLEGGGRKPGQWERARARVRQTWGFFMDVYSGTRRTGEGCGPFREKQACRFSVNILFVVCLFVCLHCY